jgi:hypothetical protein
MDEARVLEPLSSMSEEEDKTAWSGRTGTCQTAVSMHGVNDGCHSDLLCGRASFSGDDVHYMVQRCRHQSPKHVYI